MASWRMRAGLLTIASSLVGCDHATKAIAQSRLGTGAVVDVVPGLLDLRYAENYDVGFSLLHFLPEAARWNLILFIGFTMMAGLAWFWRRRPYGSMAEQTGIALLVAGGLGNLLDRMFRGYVVDFIHLHNWPVFNVADICVLFGALSLGWAWRDGRLGLATKQTPSRSPAPTPRNAPD